MIKPLIGALAPWFGAKRSIAPEIVRAIGPHRVYWEPFCGSMAVLLSKSPSRAEVVNDLHGDLINLARVIQSPTLGPALYRRLRRVWFGEQQFRDAQAAIVRSEWTAADGEPLDRAFAYFVTSWMGMNGVAGTNSFNISFARRFSSKGGDPARRWVNAVRSIPGWRRRLEGVQVLSSDGVELCERIEDLDGTAIYADPPYLVKGAAYVHDFDAADHVRLAAALNRFERTRVVVSYYDHPRLAGLYPGWRVERLDVAKSMVNSGSGMRGETGASKAPEVLLINNRREGRLFDW